MRDMVITSVLIGIFGMVFGILGKIVFDWLKHPPSFDSNSKNGNSKKATLAEILAACQWLKDVHNKSDHNGVPLWYVPRELHTTIKQTYDKINEMTGVMKEINNSVQQLRDMLVTCHGSSDLSGKCRKLATYRRGRKCS